MNKTQGIAIVSLVCGIAGIVIALFGWSHGIVAPIIAIAVGVVAIVLGVKSRGGEAKGMGTAALVLGIIALAFAVIMIPCACMCSATNTAVNGINDLANSALEGLY